MYPRPSPLQIPDRPSKYLVAAGLHWRLPNEKRQFQLLPFVAGRIRAGDSIQVVGNLDALAALLGVCWSHPDRALDTPLPWAEVDRQASLASAAVLSAPVAPEEDPEDPEAIQDALDNARTAAGNQAAWAVLVDYGENVLDELDEEGWGDRNTVGECFGAISRAIGRTFVPQEVIEDRLGFIGPQRAIPA